MAHQCRLLCRLCPCHADVVHSRPCAGVVTNDEPTSLSLLRWRCHPHRAGVFALASPLLHWRCCHRSTGIFAFYPLHGHCCQHWFDVITVLALVLLLLLHISLYQHCLGILASNPGAGFVTLGVLANVAWASSPMFCRRCRHFAGASLPLLCWHCPPRTRWHLCHCCTWFAPMRRHHCCHRAGILPLHGRHGCHCQPRSVVALASPSSR
jgi:hypothetical protein